MRTCQEDGCGGKHLARGLCRPHYYRLYWQGARDPINERRFEFRRRYADQWPPEWNDRSAFERDVGSSPSARHRLRIKDPGQPISKENLHWVAPCPVSKRPSEDEKAYRSEMHRLRKHGLLPEQYNTMLAAQHGLCAICEKPPRKRAGVCSEPRLVVDHDHKTGDVRGLLCSSCNSAIGQMEEDETTLFAAIAYLRKHQGTR